MPTCDTERQSLLPYIVDPERLEAWLVAQEVRRELILRAYELACLRADQAEADEPPERTPNQ